MFKPKFSISSDVLNAVSEISEIKVIVERSPVLPLNELQLQRDAMIRMVHSSTSIEGNKLAEYQVDKVLSGLSVQSDTQSILEVKNYQQAVKEVEKMAVERVEITPEVILKLHKLVSKGLLDNNKVGSWRPGDVYIIDDLGHGKEHLRFKGPDAKKIPYLLNELLIWLKKAGHEDLHPILKSGIFHTQFVHIHPFSDGNGRVTRLLATLILYLSNWDFRKVLVLETFYNNDRQDYYNALAFGWENKYHEGADLTPWLEYFIAGFLIEARKVREIITSLGFDKQPMDESQKYLDQDEVKIMDFLVTTFKIKSDDVANLLKIAKRTAQLKLKNLVEKKLIKMQGKGPASYYVIA